MNTIGKYLGIGALAAVSAGAGFLGRTYLDSDRHVVAPQASHGDIATIFMMNEIRSLEPFAKNSSQTAARLRMEAYALSAQGGHEAAKELFIKAAEYDDKESSTEVPARTSADARKEMLEKKVRFLMNQATAFGHIRTRGYDVSAAPMGVSIRDLRTGTAYLDNDSKRNPIGLVDKVNGRRIPFPNDFSSEYCKAVDGAYQEVKAQKVAGKLKAPIPVPTPAADPEENVSEEENQ